MIIRRLEVGDIEKGLLEVLANLSKTQEIPTERLVRILSAYNEPNGSYHVLVAEENGRIISTATLILAWKLLRGGVRAGRISDVVTHPDWEGQGIGTKLVDKLIDIAKSEGCYKITLNCNEKNRSWYGRFGFRQHEVAMRLDLG